MNRKWFLVILASAVVAAGTWWWRARADAKFKPYYRLVDSQWRPNATATAADRPAAESTDASRQAAERLTETLLNETRYVLARAPHAPVVYTEEAVVPTDGAVSFAPDVPPELTAADRIVLLPRARVGTTWNRLPAMVVTPEAAGNLKRVRIHLPVPNAAAGSTIGVHIEGFAVGSERSTSYRTASVHIPPHAYLDFAIGIPRAAWSQPPVTFTIKACDDKTCDLLFTENLDARSEAGHGWHDRRVSLESVADSTRVLAFETELQGEPQAYSFPLWANPTVFAPEKPASKPPNIILLSIDTLRADHLTSYGFSFDTAPFIDATFAKHGTVFDHCVAAATTTPPSHMTMFTSVPPCVHGLTQGMEVLPPWLTTLAQVLRENDFETGAVTEDGWLDATHGFNRGFNVYAENTSPDMMQPIGQVESTFAKGAAWLRRNKDKHFFLFLHTFQVHDPYTPPPRYRGLFTSREGQTVTEASPRPLRDVVGYDQEIRYTDDQLRLLFDALKMEGLDRNTIFIVVSDHGEEFFEHGLWGHGPHFFEEVSHVPLMFWGPGIAHGERIVDPVGHVDLMPTILELAGVAGVRQMTGVSLVPLLQGKRASASPRVLFSEAWGASGNGPDYEPILFERPGYLAQLGTRKLCRYLDLQRQPFYPFYDLATDPGEKKDIYDTHAAEVADLRTLLDTYDATCLATKTSLAGAAAGVKAEQAKLQPEQEEKLRALGYIK
ncbi:MAG: sulfatase [Deltaproteobacteria bacterium]|nr:sulfatase [Deltaproteobacteria bacterium]MBI3391481.1 sulfatase [Deltaproteobacteria bacterium]